MVQEERATMARSSVSVNGFNGVETALLVPVLRRIPWMCRRRVHSADGLCFDCAAPP